MSAQSMTPDGEPGGTRPDGAPAGPAAAEIYLRLIAEAELRQQPVISGPGGLPDSPPATGPGQ